MAREARNARLMDRYEIMKSGKAHFLPPHTQVSPPPPNHPTPDPRNWEDSKGCGKIIPSVDLDPGRRKEAIFFFLSLHPNISLIPGLSLKHSNLQLRYNMT